MTLRLYFVITKKLWKPTQCSVPPSPFVSEQFALLSAAGPSRNDTLPAERFDRVVRLERVLGFGNGPVPAIAQCGLCSHFLAGAPSMLDEVVGDAAGHIRPVVPDIALAVAGCIDRIRAKTRRHELRSTHRARVRTQRHGGVDLFLARENQELLEFVAEKLRAWRIVERQGRQRIDNPVPARNATVVGLDADNTDDHLNGYAGFLLMRSSISRFSSQNVVPAAMRSLVMKILRYSAQLSFFSAGVEIFLMIDCLDLGLAERRRQAHRGRSRARDHLIDERRDVRSVTSTIRFVGGLGAGNGNGEIAAMQVGDFSSVRQ